MCGIAAIKLKDEAKAKEIKVLKLLKLAVHTMNHRGQDGTGYVWVYNEKLEEFKNPGLAGEVYGQLINCYRNTKKEEALQTYQAIAQVRYATEGTLYLDDLQPAVIEGGSGTGRVFSFTDNGNLVNYIKERQLMENLPQERFRFDSNNEAELILRKIVNHHASLRAQNKGAEVDFIESIKYAIGYFQGSFTSILMTRNNLFAFQDKHAFHPLWFGETDDFWVICSESCTLDTLEVPHSSWRVIEAGDIYHLSDKGLKCYKYKPVNVKHCIFELIYFARPDSVQWGFCVDSYRKEKLGRQLALFDKETKANIVVPVPDSANPIAQGYAKQKEIKYKSRALIRSHYVFRTYIQATQTIRDESVKEKFNVMPGSVKDKSVVLVDDSIVRGTTIAKIVKLIFRAGAKAVHLRIGSPPIKDSCNYGMAHKYEELAWTNHGESVEGVESFIKESNREYIQMGRIFTLKYLPLESLYSSVDNKNNFCTACFDGKYPA